MDIKPFQQPDINVWTDLGPAWMIVAGAAMLVMATGMFIGIKKEIHVFVLIGLVVGTFGLMVSTGIAAGTRLELISDAYENRVSELKKSLTDDGFKIVYGTPNLNPNRQSSMLLSYEGKNFECTLYSGEDVNTSVAFSCGDAARTLEQIKETK